MKVKELWNFSYNEPILGIELGDINNNGEIEIIAYTKSGILLFLSLDGNIIRQEIISKNQSIWHLKLFDIDKDQKREIILGGIDGILKVFKCNSKLDLSLLWKHNFQSSISGIIIEDINNDNIDELIVYSLDKTIRILNPLNGNLIWGQIFEDGIGDAIFIRDHKNIILACGNDGTIRSFNCFDGKLLWFKRFSNKMRCVSYMNSIRGGIILCGGDDKILHFIDINTQHELKTHEFKDYVWLSISYPIPSFNKALVSSYSFSYFDSSELSKESRYSSNLICIDKSLNIVWEIQELNIEIIKVALVNEKNLIFIGTTNGELLIIEEITGKSLFKIKSKSCINMIQVLFDTEKIFCCRDNGTITAYELELN